MTADAVNLSRLARFSQKLLGRNRLSGWLDGLVWIDLGKIAQGAKGLISILVGFG